jgi:photosystem II stability/assembly factor-like uncharacterized protein
MAPPELKGVHMSDRSGRRILARAAACSLLLLSARALCVPADVTAALSWRLVGPMRAGWGTAVTGVADQPDVYYFGGAAGGVWKTANAGLTWTPVFEDGPASVGAIAVAPSDARTLYVGTGQITTRYDVAAGAGMFRSEDGGATWQPAGLEGTRHIAQILVDPHAARTVLVAALGHVFGPNPGRGVYRSEDGGRSWQRTLFVSENTGAVDLAADPEDPQRVYAAVWQVRFRPWLSYFTPDVGPESGIYGSSDGGRTWQRLRGNGWPAGPLGRIGLAATHTARGTRVYAVIDAEKDGGLYRSDDAGATWQRVNDDPELINGYFARLTPVPGDPDTVYAMGRSIHRCTAGGARCEISKGSPGGDDYHDMWINPVHPDHMITGADQGTVITVDGGTHWSSWYNQPTGQVYHLAADNRIPYWIYAGQQDNGTLRVASRSDYGSITFRDWSPVGADERDYDIPDPVDPDIVYGSGLGGRLSRWNARNGEVQNISPWPVVTYGVRPTAVKYRYTWITPIAVSRVPPYPLYQGAQVLFRSEDRGAHWRTVSPDLSARKAGARGCDGELAAAKARDCGYGVIFSIALSPRDNREIWVGTDDGLVRMTRDAGATWVDVTPRGVPAWAKIVTVDVGPTPGSAYVAVDNHRQDDFTPRAFRTRDYGATWTAITAGLPAGEYVTVVRADPARDGLLYAGTDRGVYLSFDDGAQWRSLRRNLPTVLVTDLLVHDRDLIVGTMGRAIWVLDDVTPLRQAAAIGDRADAVLFAPAPALRIRANQNRDTPLPPEEPAAPNPPIGAYIDYWLARDADSPLAIEIRDGHGALVRRFTSADKPADLGADRYFAKSWLHPAPAPSAQAGPHRLVWDLRFPRPKSPSYEYSIGTAWGTDTPVVPQGPLVLPGQYRVILRCNGRDYEQALSVQADPRVSFDPAGAEQALELMRAVQRSLARVADASLEVSYLDGRLDAAERSSAARATITALRKRLAVLTAGGHDDSTELADIGEVLKSLEADLEGSDAAPTEPQRQVLAASDARLERATELWQEIRGKDLAKLNAELGRRGLPRIAIPPPDQLPPARSSPGKEMP